MWLNSVFSIVFLILIFLMVWKRTPPPPPPKPAIVNIIVVATDPNRTDQLMASLTKKKGYRIHLRGLGEQWTGYDFKLRHTLALAKTLKPTDVLMHLDAYDTFVLSDATEVLYKFQAMNANIVVSTETNLAPNHEFHPIQPVMNKMYPTAPNRFRWINSGTYIGYAGAIVNLLSSMPSNFHCDLPNGQKINYSDDQRCFHTLFLKENDRHNMKLDYQQDIFHCMWGVDQFSINPKHRVYSETGSMPCVIHGNGQAPVFQEVVNTLKTNQK